VSAKLLPWLGGSSSIPAEALEAAAAVVKKAEADGAIRGSRV
jgi:hypothetical protein